jgi:DNA polymerase I-like protein with 3'-5' exonuclease and polymerase domains
VCIDVETYRTSPGVLTPKLVCLSFYDGVRNEILLRQRAIEFTRDLLIAALKGEVEIVGHRLAYDLAVITAHEPRLLPLIFACLDRGLIIDTHVRGMLLDIAAGTFEFYRDKDGRPQKNKHNFAQYVYRYLGKTRTKGADSFQLRYAELDDVPVVNWPEEARHYALDDSHDTWDLSYAQEREAGNAIPTEAMQVRSAWALHLMGVRGIRANPETVEALRRKWTAERVTLQQQLREAGIIRADGSKDLKLMRQLVKEAYTSLGREVPTTEKGEISTTKDVIADVEHPVLSLVSKYNHVDKYIGTYLPPMSLACQVPFNPSWNVLVASGRTSCGAEDSPGNLQNLPRDGNVRDAYEARDGFLYCSTDYNTAELRSLSEVCLEMVGFSIMAEEFKLGRDPHLAFAADIMGIEYAAAESNKKSKDVKYNRQFGKIFNFGAPGGMGPASLAEYAKNYGVKNLDIATARRIHAAWKRHYPEMAQYHNIIQHLVRTQNMMQHPITGFVRATGSFTEMSNHLFQHLTASGAKQALYEVTRECYLGTSKDGQFDGVKQVSPLKGSFPVLFIHDEIISEVPEARAHEAGYRQAEVCTNEMSKLVKRVPNPVEPALMKRWYKEAETVLDNERLVAWEPQKKAA